MTRSLRGVKSDVVFSLNRGESFKLSLVNTGFSLCRVVQEFEKKQKEKDDGHTRYKSIISIH